MGVHRTCGEPDEIELTAIGVELNGSGRVPLVMAAMHCLSPCQMLPER